jgi:hypothetical protein
MKILVSRNMEVKRPISIPSVAPSDLAYTGRKGVIILAPTLTMNVEMARMTTEYIALIDSQTPEA